jgi:predicted phage baseplate assembly protein
VTDEPLGKVPPVVLFDAPDCSADRCDPPPRAPIPPRYRPRLAKAPLTQAAGRLIETAGGRIGTRPERFDPFAPAHAATTWSIRDVLPQLRLASTFKASTRNWQAQRTLLESAGGATDFVVEVDDDAAGELRFGDGEHGERPQSGTAFTGNYRVGNGAAGNVGAESIFHFVAASADLPHVLAVRNPLPARGGIDPETSADVRRNAPEAFRTQERAVTTDDYAEVVERNRNVQRAAATLRWTGSWYTVFNTVDPVAGVDAVKLRADLAPFVDRYRMAVHDLEFNAPHYVSLEIELHVCVKDDYFRSDVRQGLLRALGAGALPDGRRGLFHPDNWTFGQSVFLAPIYAAAHRVAGVASVEVKKFQRQGTPNSSYLLKGELPLGRLEIARLDNDRNFPEHGVLRLDIHGGR